MKKCVLILAFLIICINSFTQHQYDMSSAHNRDPKNPEYVDDEVLVKFKDKVEVNLELNNSKKLTNIIEINSLLENFYVISISKVFSVSNDINRKDSINIQGKIRSIPALNNIYKLKVKQENDILNIVSALTLDPLVEYAEPNYIIYSIGTYPDDPIYLTGAQWHIDTVKAPQAWDINISDTSQIIGIIDTGVDWDHPDLDDNIWTNWDDIPGNGIDDDNNGYIDDIRGWDFVNNDNNPTDDNSHGTHVAGIAAAETNNGIGIAGIAWNARIMPVKMLQSSGQGNSSDFAAAIAYASENGATVINMSVGSYAESLTVKTALEYAYSSSLLIAAAGNDGFLINFAPMYPACYSFVIGVEASNFYNEITDFSNFDADGPTNSVHFDLRNYEIRAPGYGIYSTFPNGNYYALSGTSMSAPIVSGAAAILKNYHAGISHEQMFVRFIQGADSLRLDIYKSLTMTPEPDLMFLEYTIYDTLPGCDGDGLPDAGESIVLNIKVRNVGSYSDSTWSHFKLGTFEDTTVAVVSDSLSTLGNISAYATLSNYIEPFIIQIDSGLAHNRDIVFDCIISSKNTDTVHQEIILTIQNAEELVGVMDSTMYLTPDKLWVVNGSFRVEPSGHLIILPGASIILEKPVINNGLIEGLGTADSMIIVYGPEKFERGEHYNFWYTHFLPGDKPMKRRYESFPVITKENDQGINKEKDRGTNMDHCIFDGALNIDLWWGNITDCIFKNCEVWDLSLDSIYNCNFYNTVGNTLFNSGATNFYIGYCNFSHIGNSRIFYGGNNIHRNNFITNLSTTTYHFWRGDLYFPFPPNYWGTTDTIIIDQMIYDFHEDPNLGIVMYQPILEVPSDSAHGFPWKVHINDVNPQDSTLDPFGPETIKFDVFFNRPMDTAYTPKLSFGVREPYTQHIITNNASWSNDSAIWTAYYTIALETGDGINYIRIAEAVDNEGFEIPIEDNKRFFFTIQAAGALSITFTANPGIGRTLLNWEKATSTDVLGYNMYRFYNITDTTYSDTILINNALITDTNYVDFAVIPDTTYNYLYKVVGTDMIESDFSKKASCVPLPTSVGDCNADGEINVLDITTIVSYMLNQSPTPFLFDAADVNYDDEINVLDIIGLVQLINGKKSSTTQPLPEISNETAYYYFDEDKLGFESKGNVAAMQFKLKVKNEKLKMKSNLDKLRIFSIVQGFEFAYAVVDDYIIGILYSLSGREIPEGITNLFRFEGVDISNVEITEIFGGDLSGNYVPILKKGTNSVVFSSDAELQVSPNPFTYSTQINYTVQENGLVEIRIYNMNGAEINLLQNRFQTAGKHSINWNGTNEVGQQMKSGIYLIQLKVKSVSGNSYNKEIKIVLTK